MIFQKVVDWVNSFFKKYEYPSQFVVVKFTDQAKKYGIFMDEGKEIIYFKYNEITNRHDEFRVFNYSEQLIESFLDKHIPVFDTTQEVHKFQTIKKIRPEIMTYEYAYD